MSIITWYFFLFTVSVRIAQNSLENNRKGGTRTWAFLAVSNKPPINNIMTSI